MISIKEDLIIGRDMPKTRRRKNFNKKLGLVKMVVIFSTCWIFNLSLIRLLAHFLVITHRRQCIFLGECFLLFTIFPIFSLRDLDRTVATVNCSSNDVLTNILATPLSATSDFIGYLRFYRLPQFLSATSDFIGYLRF